MQSCEFVIRPLTGNDAGAVLAFSRQIGGETDHLTFGPEGLPLGEEQERGFLEKAADTPDRLMLGAWDGERRVPPRSPGCRTRRAWPTGRSLPSV